MHGVALGPDREGDGEINEGEGKKRKGGEIWDVPFVKF